MANNTLGLQSPWITTYNKIFAIFGRDEDLVFSNVEKDSTEEGVYSFTITSNNSVKLSAIEKIMKNEFTFGNVTLRVKFIYETENAATITASDFKNAFSGNNILSKVETIETPWKFNRTFVVFGREVIQFYNDDITDFYGNFNGLAEDIAQDIFKPVENDISFCTDIIPAN